MMTCFGLLSLCNSSIASPSTFAIRNPKILTASDLNAEATTTNGRVSILIWPSNEKFGEQAIPGRS